MASLQQSHDSLQELAKELKLVVPDRYVQEPQPEKSKLNVFFVATYFVLLKGLGHIFTLATRAIHDGLVIPLRQHWCNYYPRVAVVEQSVVMPHSSISFIINALLAFIEIKSQCQPGFPFKTHPHFVTFSVTSLLMYGFACVIELVISAASLDPTSIYAIIARLGKIGSLCVLMASLACLFYF